MNTSKTKMGLLHNLQQPHFCGYYRCSLLFQPSSFPATSPLRIRFFCLEEWISRLVHTYETMEISIGQRAGKLPERKDLSMDNSAAPPQKRGKGSNILVGAFILTVSSLLTRLIGFVFRIYLSNKLGTEGIGLYQLVFSIYALGSTIVTAGISVSVCKLVAEEIARNKPGNARTVLKKAVRLSGCLGVCVGAAVFFLAQPIALYMLKDPRATASLRCLSLVYPVVGITACYSGYFYAVGRIYKPVFAQVFEQLVRIGVTLAVLDRFLGGGMETGCIGAFAGVVAGELLSCLSIWILYRSDAGRSEWSHTLPDSRFLGGKAYRMILSLSVPLALSSYLNSVLHTMENVLIPQRLLLFGMTNEAALSVYGMIKGMVMPMIYFPSSLLVSISTMLVPEISKASAVNNRQRVDAAVSRAFQITLLLCFAVVGGLLIFSDDLGQAVYHSSEVGQMLRLVSLASPLIYLQIVITGLLNGLGLQTTVMRNGICESVARVVMIWLLLPKFGFQAYLWTIILCNLLSASLNIGALYRATTLSVNLRRHVIFPLLSAGISCLLVRWLCLSVLAARLSQAMQLVLGIPLLFVVYFALILLTGCLTSDDIGWIQEKFRRRKAPSLPGGAEATQ